MVLLNVMWKLLAVHYMYINVCVCVCMFVSVLYIVCVCMCDFLTGRSVQGGTNSQGMVH